MVRALIFASAVSVTWLAVPLARAEPGQISWTTYFRIGPGRDYAVRDEIPAATNLDVLECSGAWCRVVYGDRVGYVSASVVTKPLPPLPPADPHSCVNNRRTGYGRGDELSICER